MINLHSHTISENSIFNIDIRNIKVPSSKFSIGIHPWYIEDINLLSSLVNMKLHASNPNCILLGEMGLDKVSNISYNKQIHVFEAQIDLANKLNMNIILHCVRAYNDIVFSLKRMNFQNYFIFHDYNGDLETTRSLLKQKCFFSYGDKLFRETTKGYKSLDFIPLDRIFLETDECIHSISDAYNEMANIKNISKLEVINQIKSNFSKLQS